MFTELLFITIKLYEILFSSKQAVVTKKTNMRILYIAFTWSNIIVSTSLFIIAIKYEITKALPDLAVTRLVKYESSSGTHKTIWYLFLPFGLN